MNNINFTRNEVDVTAEAGASINVDALVSGANDQIASANERLANLTPTFASRIKTNIVNYWRNAVNRFDTDAEVGLDQAEFDTYRTDMIAKVVEVIDQYAPSVEAQAQAAEAAQDVTESTEQVDASIDAVESVEISDIAGQESLFDPEHLKDPTNIANALTNFHELNVTLNQQITELQQQSATFQQNFANLQESRRTFAGTWGSLFSSSDEPREIVAPNGNVMYVPTQDQLEQQHQELVATLRAKQQEATAYSSNFDRYGQNLNDASNNLITDRELQRDQALTELGVQRSELTEMNEQQREAMLEALDRQRQLSVARDNLVSANELVLQRRSSTEQASLGTQENQLMLQGAQSDLATAIVQVEAELSREDLTEEQRTLLTGKLTELQANQLSLDSAITQTTAGQEAAEVTQTALASQEVENTTRLTDLTGVQSTLDSSITSLNESIDLAGVGILDNLSQADQINLNFNAQIDELRGFDADIENTVLDSILISSQAVDGLSGTVESIAAIQVDQGLGHDIWDFTGGLIGGGLSSLGHTFQMLADGISRVLPVPIVSDVLAGVSSFTGGVIEGASQLLENIDMIFTRQGVAGIAALLVGRDPETGEWFSGEVYGNSFSALAAAFAGSGNYTRMVRDPITGEMVEDTTYARGVGVAVFNVVSTLAGIGAVSNGFKAGVVASRVGRTTVGLTRIQSFARGVNVGSRLAIRTLGDDLGRLGGGILASPGRMARFMYNLPSRLVTGPIAISSGLVRLGDDLARVASEVSGFRQVLDNAIQGFGDLPPNAILNMSLDDFVRMFPEDLTNAQRVSLIRNFNRTQAGFRRMTSLADEMDSIRALSGTQVDDILNSARSAAPLDDMTRFEEVLSLDSRAFGTRVISQSFDDLGNAGRSNIIREYASRNNLNFVSNQDDFARIFDSQNPMHARTSSTLGETVAVFRTGDDIAYAVRSSNSGPWRIVSNFDETVRATSTVVDDAARLAEINRRVSLIEQNSATISEILNARRVLKRLESTGGSSSRIASLRANLNSRMESLRNSGIDDLDTIIDDLLSRDISVQVYVQELRGAPASRVVDDAVRRVDEVVDRANALPDQVSSTPLVPLETNLLVAEAPALVAREASNLAVVTGQVDDATRLAVVQNVETALARIVPNANTNTALLSLRAGDLVPITNIIVEAVTRGAPSKAGKVLMAAVLATCLVQDNANATVEEVKTRVFEDLDIDIPTRTSVEVDRTPVGYIDSPLDISTIESVYDPIRTLVSRAEGPWAAPRFTRLNSRLSSNYEDVPVEVSTAGDSIFVRDASGAQSKSVNNGESLVLTGNSINFRLRSNSAESAPYVRYFEVKGSDGVVDGYVAGAYLKMGAL